MQPESCFIPVAYFILDHLRERKSWCPCNWEYKALGGIVYLSPNLHRIQFWKRPAIPTEELLALSLIISLYMKHSLPSSFRQGILGLFPFDYDACFQLSLAPAYWQLRSSLPVWWLFRGWLMRYLRHRDFVSNLTQAGVVWEGEPQLRKYLQKVGL